MWFYFKGVRNEARKYPYKAVSPFSKGKVWFKSMDDVLQELQNLYDESVEKGVEIGHSLYHQIPFFTSDIDLLDVKTQSTIKGMRYSTQTNTAPYPSLKETPAEYVNKFIWFTDEYNAIINAERDK